MIALACKLSLGSWGLYEGLRYIVQRLIMIPLYPAQSRLVKFMFPVLRAENLSAHIQAEAEGLALGDFRVRHVVLEKNGVRYSGLMIGHSTTIDNGQWVLQATGNAEPIEHTAELCARTYQECGFNTLMINGPAVGRSQGHATPQTLGEAQEIGLCFLESALKAKKIVLAGRSLGGAAMGQAILQHTFHKEIQYLAVRQMSFDRVSNVCGKIVGQLFPRLEGVVSRIIHWSGCEMDSVAASKRLQQLGIQEVIIQASREGTDPELLPTIDHFYADGVILAEASLGHALIREGITGNKRFYCLLHANHMTHDAIEATAEAVARMNANS